MWHITGHYSRWLAQCVVTWYRFQQENIMQCNIYEVSQGRGEATDSLW